MKSGYKCGHICGTICHPIKSSRHQQPTRMTYSEFSFCFKFNVLIYFILSHFKWHNESLKQSCRFSGVTNTNLKKLRKTNLLRDSNNFIFLLWSIYNISIFTPQNLSNFPRDTYVFYSFKPRSLVGYLTRGLCPSLWRHSSYYMTVHVKHSNIDHVINRTLSRRSFSRGP